MLRTDSVELRVVCLRNDYTVNVFNGQTWMARELAQALDVPLETLLRSDED